MLKTTRVVDANKVDKVVWRLADMEFNTLEKIAFRIMLSEAIGRKSIDELKNLGELSAKRNGGLQVKFPLGDKTASMLFGQKWGKYEYRDTLFFSNKKKEM